MNFRILFLSLVGLMALRCGDNPAWSNDLGIKVEATRIEIEKSDTLRGDNIDILQCVITLSKEGRSFTEDEGVRLVVDFFNGDTSLRADAFEVAGLLGNDARTEVRGTFGGWFDTPPTEIELYLDYQISDRLRIFYFTPTKPDPLPDRCEVTSITLAQ